MYSVDMDASFIYNENGLRVQKTVNGVVTKYTLHGKNIVHMTQGSNELHFFYDAQNKPAVVVFNGTPYSYVKNLQGDIVAILNSAGTAVVNYVYDAWGRPISKTGSMASTLGTVQPFRYRGYVYDEETELYYLRSRYNNPNYCRFLNKDIWLSTGAGLLGCNTFAYCNNSPVIFTDSCGKSPRKDVFQVCIRFEDNAYEYTLGEYINSIIPPEVKEREREIIQDIVGFDPIEFAKRLYDKLIGIHSMGDLFEEWAMDTAIAASVYFSECCLYTYGPVGLCLGIPVSVMIIGITAGISPEIATNIDGKEHESNDILKDFAYEVSEYGVEMMPSKKINKDWITKILDFIRFVFD